MKMKEKEQKQLSSEIFDQFFLYKYIRRSSVVKVPKTNIIIFHAKRVKTLAPYFNFCNFFWQYLFRL